ncbi:hypothetical protein KJ840_01675 [Patescibacteria group bacterium]|nr:hypothetical protein [Patescibacteria group bacterium]
MKPKLRNILRNLIIIFLIAAGFVLIGLMGYFLINQGTKDFENGPADNTSAAGEEPAPRPLPKIPEIPEWLKEVINKKDPNQLPKIPPLPQS